MTTENALLLTSTVRNGYRGYEMRKRYFDVSCALLALVFLSPLLLIVGLLIFLGDRGHPIFYQTRVGKSGREFKFYKFRSMVKDAEARKLSLAQQNQHSDDRTFKMKNDPRITAIGRFIRRTSIDELPQLWNIVQGEMSIVGPRPAVPSEVAMYSPADRRRLLVTPGLTCIWQVSGRSEIPFPQQVEMDVEYIRSRSMRLDLTLIAMTIPAVFSVRGAY